MSEVSRRFEQLISASQKKLAENKQILPVKTDKGILVGDVLIASEANLKYLWKRDQLVYKEISLNDVAIKLANLLALNVKNQYCDQLYRADQEYGLYFAEWNFLKQQYHRAVQQEDFDRADILRARYEQCKYRADNAKQSVTILLKS
jgi:hypothetical protein